MVLTAEPERGYLFSGWEGDVLDTNNPATIFLDSNKRIRARFRFINYSDAFESGDWSRLPWQVAKTNNWILQTNQVAGGRWAARSAAIGNEQNSLLILPLFCQQGTGFFDFKTSSEEGWDWLEFSLNGKMFATMVRGGRLGEI